MQNNAKRAEFLMNEFSLAGGQVDMQFLERIVFLHPGRVPLKP